MPSIIFLILLLGNSTSFNQVWWNGKWVCMIWSIREYEGAFEVYRLNIAHAQLIIVYVRFGLCKVCSSRLCLDCWENKTTRIMKLTLASRLVVKTGLTIMFFFQAARSRDAATAMILELAVHKDIKVCNSHRSVQVR